MTTTLTPDSESLFRAYAEDAENWGGAPCVGANIDHTQADNGNLTDLKKKGLLVTQHSDGEEWIFFTDAGVDLIKEMGIFWLDEQFPRA